jgi:hypothetical protein
MAGQNGGRIWQNMAESLSDDIKYFDQNFNFQITFIPVSIASVTWTVTLMFFGPLHCPGPILPP